MTTGNTTLLKLALPTEGELDGTWGDVVNNSITSLVDSAIAGTVTLSTDADVTLTDLALEENQARQAVLLWTASNGATTRSITAPARSKPYIVINAGTGSVVLRGAGPTAGITVVAGEKCLAAWNGSDFVKIASSVPDVTGPASAVTGSLAAFDGTTGKLLKNASFTAENVLLGNGTGVPKEVAPGALGNVLTSNGTTWTSTAPAGQSYPAAGLAVSTGSGWGTSKTTPTGEVVGTTDTQTLTNKSIGTGSTWEGNTVGVGYGGTGSASLTLNNVLLGNGTSALQVVAPGTSGNVLTSNGTTWASTAQTTVNAGAVVFFAVNAAPTGWLKANGAAISRTTYAALFAVIGTTFGTGDGSTTFNVPDLRGQFARGWDDGRGVDTGRVFGSAQLDAFQDHTHNTYAGGANSAGTGGSAKPIYALTASSGATGRTATETRPVNVALLACIKF